MEYEEESLKTELARFKRMVKTITNHSNDFTKILFSQDNRNMRLRGMAIYGHTPAIRAIPCMSEDAHLCTVLVIMQQRIGYNAAQGRRITRWIEGQRNDDIYQKPKRMMMQKVRQNLKLI